jgi:DNA replication protein DnaC
MSTALCYQQLREHLEVLKLAAALRELDGVLARAQQEDKLAIEVLAELLAHERRERFERRVQANMQLSGLPFFKRLEDYDFAAQPQVPKRTIEEVATRPVM